ncbi:MAG: hypothetical protein GWM91_19075, partial [Actinobacteria bacterium]|nr:hypothetical protein [Actinomycetota bacterium]NIX52371.1 hypothetical protein [Actinomycetota bacterium]
MEICVDGVVQDTCDPFEGMTTDESCDGVDDDCDGSTDEDFVGPATDCGLGQCAGNTGNQICVDGMIEDTCDPLDGAVPDTDCDGLDDDCDGTPDDEFSGVATTCGLGECAGNSGNEVCVDGAVQDTCDPLDGAVPEACNGLDDDCDGGTDEGCTCGDGIVAGDEECDDGNADDTDACRNDCTNNTCNDGDGDGYGSPGNAGCPNGPAEDCDDGDPGVNPGADEVLCDGKDNDCDGGGTTPDDVNADGDPVSFCSGDCDDTDPNNYPGNTEICDGQDNDCDSSADEGNPGAGQSCGASSTGECNLGTTACIDGVLECVNNVDPCLEICDGLDNDCDGLTDEDDAVAAWLHENFDTAGDGENPPWLDTGVDNSLLEDPDAYEILFVNGNAALGTERDLKNTHSHYVVEGSEAWRNYTVKGRLRFEHWRAGAGVTVYSAFPADDHYYRFRSYPQEPFLQWSNDPNSPHGAYPIDCDVPDTGVDPGDGAWYWFEVQVESTPETTWLRGKAWRDGDPYPVSWQQICSHSEPQTIRSEGRVGLWTKGPGLKAFDDLVVVPNPGTVVECGSDEGECQTGQQTCQNGEVVCSGQVEAVDELCDGLDNDCDGDTDNGDPEGGGQCGTSDVGECQFGVEQCEDGALVCNGNVDPV